MKARTEQVVIGLSMGASIGISIGVVFGEVLLGFVVGLGIGALYHMLWPAEGLREDMMPFTLAASGLGLLEHRGKMYLDDEFLVFELKSLLAGVENKKQQIVKIEPHALASVRLDEGSLCDAICIKPKKADLLTVVPGNHEHELRLEISKQHRMQGEDLVASLRKMLGRYNIKSS